MNKKILTGVALILLIIAGIFFFRGKGEAVYSDNPETWFEGKGSGRQYINVDKVTKGTGWDEEDQIYAIFDGVKTVFPYEGFYQGEYFEKQMIENNRDIKMKISSTLDNNDGIIEGYIVERKVNESLEVFIFLDQDWKNLIPQTNIIWGEGYSKTKPFIFNEVSDGVYMDRIIDDSERFDFNYLQSNTGIIVGDVTQEKVLNGITAGVTAIIFQ